MELHSATGRLVAPKVIGGGPGLVSPDLVDALGEASMQLQATLLLNRYHRVAWGGAEGQSGTTPLEVAGSQDCGRNPKQPWKGGRSRRVHAMVPRDTQAREAPGCGY